MVIRSGKFTFFFSARQTFASGSVTYLEDLNWRTAACSAMVEPILSMVWCVFRLMVKTSLHHLFWPRLDSVTVIVKIQSRDIAANSFLPFAFSSNHFNIKETVAVLRAIERWRPLWASTRLNIYTDSSTVFTSLSTNSIRGPAMEPPSSKFFSSQSNTVGGIRVSQKAGRSTGEAWQEGKGQISGTRWVDRFLLRFSKCLEVPCLVDARRQSLCP
jgi:hypothetical protein